MKYNAKDTTILILYRGDSLQRLENVIAVINNLHSFFDINIYVREADAVCNNILSKMTTDSVMYEYVEDDDPTLYKTWHFNDMLHNVKTKFVGIWDADVIAYNDAIIECIEQLRAGTAKLAIPYNGVCLDTSVIIRNIYMKTNEMGVLTRQMQKMRRLQNHVLTGGAVLMERTTFALLGNENENYYGWGDDDFDRYIRFLNSGYGIFRSSKVLFHLSHIRGQNSSFSSILKELYSKAILSKTKRAL